MQNLTTKTFSITGMTCIHCQNTIENALKETKAIHSVKVSYKTSLASVTYDSSIINFAKVKSVIEKLDYGVASPSDVSKTGLKDSIVKFIGVAVVLFVLFKVIQMFGLLDFMNEFPIAEQGMGYGLLFIIGLLTSVHCVAMCSGIALSQCIPTNNPQTKSDNGSGVKSTLRPAILYNAGRVISYTVIGGIVGGIGSVIILPGMAKGLVAIIAGIFMVIMGLNMLSLFPSLRKFAPKMPQVFARKIYQQKKSNTPFYVGLLNGLMPCGPLQAMQLYALSTGSPVKGALSMMIFSLGTVPLMFGLSAVSSYMSKNFAAKVRVVSATLVVILGVFMLSNGMSLSGIAFPSLFGNQASSEDNNSSVSSSIDVVNSSDASGNFQLITTDLANGYEEITVKKGIPVKWTIKAKSRDINGCNRTMVIPAFEIEKKLSPGDNIIEFTPTESGIIPYSCWMGMINSQITVID